jgi:hypothetical protein
MAEPMKVNSMITQDELQEFCAIRAQYKKMQEDLKHKLEAGVEVQFGVHSAKLVEVQSKRPNWKAFILRKHGKKTVERIMNATRPISYLRMEVK